jgi:hypothetical protein
MRRRILGAILVAAAVWPLFLRAAVRRFDVNPWKFGGFAMYTTPTPPILVALLRAVPGGFRALDPRTLPAPVRAQLDRFQMERHALGTLREPDDVARAVLAAQPELPGLVVMVQRMKLDPATARMTSRRDRYVYDRAEFE